MSQNWSSDTIQYFIVPSMSEPADSRTQERGLHLIKNMFSQGLGQ